MSADNWTYCPQCGETAEEQFARLTAELNALYGKISPDEYLGRAKLIGEAKAPEQTLREDYDLGMTKDGLFSVDYRATCTTCDFTFQHKHEEQVKVKRKTPKPTE